MVVRESIILMFLALRVVAQTWCGKNYMSTSPIVPPGGDFPIPATSSSPLLALRCAQAIKPYLASDDPSSAAFLIDTPITNSFISGAAPLPATVGSLLSSGTELKVTITAHPINAEGTAGSIGGGITLASGVVPLNHTKVSIPFSLSKLSPTKNGYSVTCSGTLTERASSNTTFSHTTKLFFLPDPTDGTSVAKIDATTGAVLKRPLNGSKDFEPIYPIGYYTAFDGYLVGNLSVLDVLKEQGFTVVHPIPTYDNTTALLEIMDRMAELGLHLMYDMRGTYMNLTSVTEQVELVKSHPALLTWYTADEPDGTSDPLNATLNAHDLIMSLDGGGYHPVSLVLNCENYYFENYSAGAEIVMQDAYTIGNNLNFSTVWDTPCTDDYGDCGCDNCHTGFPDIATRMDEFYERLFILGRELDSTVWAVPQGFGNDTYWPRYPTGNEWVVQSIIGINHGALGVVSWDDPTSADIKAVSSQFALSLPSITPFIFSHSSTFRQITTSSGVDVGVWTVPGDGTLVLATNMNYASVSVGWSEIGVSGGRDVKVVYSGGATTTNDGFELIEVGSGAFILK